MQKIKKLKIAAYACFFIILTVFCLSGTALAASDYYNAATEWQYTIYHRVLVENPKGNDVLDLEIKVPLMDTEALAYQTVISEQLFPLPHSIIADKNGNREAIYKIPLLKSGEKLVLEQRYGISSFSVEYKLDTKPDSNLDTDISLDQYLLPESGIESSSEEIMAYAKQIASSETNPYNIARKVFGDVNRYLTYDGTSSGEQGAIQTLKIGSGNCNDYSRLYVAVLRSLGIPARVRTGYLYMPKEHGEAPYTDSAAGRVNVSYMSHAWAEVYLQGIGWVIADPTFTYTYNFDGNNEPTKLIDWSYFAEVPSSRRYLSFREGTDKPDKIYHDAASGTYNISFDAYLTFGNNVQPFNDIENHYAKDDVVYLYNRGLISGIGNGVFGVNYNVTRAQMAALLSRMNLIDEAEYKDVSFKVFSDVAPAHWAYGSIGKISKAGLMVGFNDGTFRPDDVLTRGEMAVVLVRAFGLQRGSKQVAFLDLDTPGFGYAKESITILASLGYSKGMQKGLYQPEKLVARGEMAVFISRIVKDIPE